MSVFKRTIRGKKSRNYCFEFTDEHGVLRRRASGTSDKRLAEQLLRKEVNRVREATSGLVDPADARFRDESRKLISEHVADYVAACEGRGDDEEAIRGKKRALAWFVSVVGEQLSEVRADNFDARLAGLTEEGLSARTVNLRLAQARALYNWLVRNGRVRSNPLVVIPRRNELADRRLIRRVLTPKETSSLIAVARAQAETFKVARVRVAWYLLPLLAGARRSDMERMRWADFELAGKTPTWTVRKGKAKHRVDRLPLHPELVAELNRIKPPETHPTAHVFPHIVANGTRVRDFQKAGIVADKPEGRADLHSLRHTFATRLVLAGCAPVRLKFLMRHAKIETTMAYYTHLSVADLAEGIALLPGVEGVS